MRRYFYLSSLIAAVLLASPPIWGSEVSTWTTDADSNNKPAPDGWTSGTMLPNQVEPTAREMMAAIARWYQNGRTPSFPSSFGTTPTSKVIFNTGGFPIAGEIPQGVLQAYDCGIVVPNSYTGAPWPNVCYAGYIDNQNSANTNSVVSFFATGYANAPGTGTIGNNVTNFNGVVSNTDPSHGYFAPNLGKDFGQLVGVEADVNIWKKPGGITPGGKIDGFIAITGLEVVPTGGMNAFHVQVAAQPPTPAMPWTNGFIVDPGAALTAIKIGAVSLDAGAQPSGGIQLDATTVLSTIKSGTIQVSPDGGTANLDLGVPASGSVRVLVDSAVQYYLNGFGLYGADVAVAPGASGPFIYVNGMTAGAPSGIPLFASDGRVPLVVDLTNHKLCWYEHTPAVWKCVTGA